MHDCGRGPGEAPLVFLDDVLEQRGFAAAIDRIARAFRVEHGLPAIDEIGLVAANAVAASNELERRGIDPLFLAEGSAAMFQECGRDTHFETRVGFVYHEGILVELAEAGRGSELFKNSVDPGGRITVHHIGFTTGDAEAQVARFPGRAVTRARVDFGPYSVKLVILDTQEEIGVALEFLEVRFLGFPAKLPAWALALGGRIEKWTGFRVLHL